MDAAICSIRRILDRSSGTRPKASRAAATTGITTTQMNSEEATNLYAEAVEHYEDGRIDEALQVVNRLLRAYPDNRQLLWRKSICLGKLRRFEEARAVAAQLRSEEHDESAKRLLAWLNSRDRVSKELHLWRGAIDDLPFWRRVLMLFLQQYLLQDELFVAPEIPPERIQRALRSCELPEGEELIALIESSLDERGGNCVIFGLHAIHFLTGSQSKTPLLQSVSYRDLPGRVFRSAGAGAIDMDRGQLFRFTGFKFPTGDLMHILYGIKHLVGGNYHVDRDVPLYDAIIYALRRFLPNNGFHVWPDIPANKHARASVSCKLAPTMTALALLDCTTFGSAQNAVIFTVAGLYYHNSSVANAPGPGFIAYAHIPELIEADGTAGEIDLGGGQRIETSGSSIDTATIIEMFIAVKSIANEYAAR